MKLDPNQRRELLALARASIESALPQGTRTTCPRDRLPADLMERRSSFVTLRIDGKLRGCCGTIDAPRPLAEDIWHNAWVSAFRDPRFPGLAACEWPRVGLHISVLSTPQPLPVACESELLLRLQPFVDGLILEFGDARATFLPSVWKQLAEPGEFLRQLKLKAGWSADFWSPDLRIFRYTAEGFGEEEEQE